MPTKGYHFHQCGLTLHNACVDLNIGCGHVWGHFEGNHKCPNCGREGSTAMMGLRDITCKEISRDETASN